jgi:hypothetical protein
MKFSAHFVVPANGPVLPRAIVEVDASGTILQLTETTDDFREQAGLEFHSGILCPALIDLWHYATTNDILQKLPELEPFRKFIPANTNDPKAAFNWLKAIQENLPENSLPELIALFTARAAKTFHLTEAGTIAPGKRPGLVILSGIDYANFRLKPDSRLKKLI